MTTTLKRINISLSKSAVNALGLLAKRDQEPVATKASALLMLALELEEDRALVAIAEARDTKDATWISHEKVWGKKRSTR